MSPFLDPVELPSSACQPGASYAGASSGSVMGRNAVPRLHIAGCGSRKLYQVVHATLTAGRN